MQTVEQISIQSQVAAPQEVRLSESDRRLLICASLRLFLRRLNHNLPVNRSDLLRVACYAPEESEVA